VSIFARMAVWFSDMSYETYDNHRSSRPGVPCGRQRCALGDR
jgi:hypothetical protein